MSAPATPPDAVQELTSQLSSGVQLNDNQDPKPNSEPELTNQPDQDQNGKTCFKSKDRPQWFFILPG